MVYINDVYKGLQTDCTGIGKPCIYVEFFGCDVGCNKCRHLQSIECKKRSSINKIMGRIFKQGIDLKNVVITGGEPLIQFNELYPLVYELLNDDYKVAIETGNCYKLPRDTYRRSFRYLVDCKTPSSGVAKKNVFTNLALLSSTDEVKFSIQDLSDYEFALKTLRTYPTCAKVVFYSDNPKIIECIPIWLFQDRLYNIQFIRSENNG